MRDQTSKQTQDTKKYIDLDAVQHAMSKAVRSALKKHKQAGHKVPVWSQGQVVYVEPEF
ncbi:MAG: hypothetical protein ACLFRL_06935 [Desulfohalobiaceae bacterium]